MNQIVSEAVSLLNPPANIHVAIQEQLPSILCERSSMAQVFQNLIGNAIKYSDKPEGEIKISTEEEDEFWKFCVADNGPGIEKRDFDKIFQMFGILQPRDKVEASGVGLAVVKKIIDIKKIKIFILFILENY